jgi:hypothetical protein
MELSRRRGVAARTSGQAGFVGWSEPARMFAAALRLSVLIEGIPMSCRDTTSHAPSGGPTSLIANSQSQALALLEQYPYRSRPTLPTHQSLIRHEPRYRCDNAGTVAGEMSHDLSVCHSRAPSRCEHLIMLHAMRLLHSPTVRRLRSLIELLALDDNHTRTTLQFVSRQIGHRRCQLRTNSHGLTTTQSISFSEVSV